VIDIRKIIKIVIISIGALVLIYVAFLIYQLIPRSYIKFTTAPSSVVVLVDNNDKHYIKNGDTLTVAPGKHTVTVFEDEFNPDLQQIEVENGKTYDFTSALLALTKSARSKLANAESDLVLEKIDAKNQNKFGTIIENKNPVFGILPIQEEHYTISDCRSQRYLNDPIAVAICIEVDLSATGPEWDYKSDALDKLRSSTFYSIEDYEIIWDIILPYGSSD